MIIKNSALAGLVMMSVCSSASWAESDDYYLGIGVGQSSITPETNSVALTVSKDSDFAYKLFGGYQWDEHWATEVFYSALGEAEISATTGVLGTVDYDTYGAAAMYKFGLTQDIDFNITGGIGKLQNKSNGISVERVEDIFIYGGLGLQWQMTRDWDVRVDADVYDSDAQLLAISLVRRFGSVDKRIDRRLHRQSQQQSQQQGMNAVSAYNTGDKVSSTDNDADGVVDTADKCPQSKTGDWVDAAGCSREDELLQTLLFDFDSVELSSEAKQQLDKAVDIIKQMPDNHRIEISAYADTVGSSMYNYALSSSRAHKVRNYLNAKGIALGKLEAEGFGEWHPATSDSGESAQKLNRRVELKIVRD